MPTEVGSAISKYSLDLRGLREGIREAKELLNDFRAEVAKEYTANIRINAKVVGQNAVASARAAAQAAPTVLSGSAATATQQVVQGANAQAAAVSKASDAIEVDTRNKLRAAIASREYAVAEKILTDAIKAGDAALKDTTQLRIALASVQTRLSQQNARNAVLAAEEARALGNYKGAVDTLVASLKGLSTTSAEYYQISRALRTTAEEAAAAGANESAARARVAAGLKTAVSGIDDETASRVRAAVQATKYAEALRILEAAQANYIKTGRDTREIEQAHAAVLARLQVQTGQTALANAKLARDTGDTTGALLTLRGALGQISTESNEYLAISKEINSIMRESATESTKHAISLAKEAAATGDLTAALAILDKQIDDLDKGSDNYNAALKTRADLVRQAEKNSQDLADTYTRELSNARKLKEAYDNNRNQSAALGPRNTPDKAQRGAELDAEAATLTTRMADAEDRLFRSTVNLTRSMGDYQEAIRILEAALATMKEGTTAWNNMQALTNDMYARATRASQAEADALIREAKSRGDARGAIALYRAELDKAGNSATRNANLQSGLNKTIADMPSFTKLMTGALGRLATPLATAALATVSLAAAIRSLVDAFKLMAELDNSRRVIGALLQNVERGNTVFAQAIKFGQQYAFTQKEMGEAAGDAAILMQQSAVGAEQMFSVLARLQARAPSKTFNDAVRSVAELQGGQLQSLERVFNIPQRYAKRLKEEVDRGIDPIIALDALLTKLGITAQTLEERTKGPQGQLNRLAVATENFRLSAANLLGGPATAFVQFFASGFTGISHFIDAMRNLIKIRPTDLVTAFTAAGKLIVKSLKADFDSVGDLVLDVIWPMRVPLDIIGGLLGGVGAAGALAGKRNESASKAAAAAAFDHKKAIDGVIDSLIKQQSLQPATAVDAVEQLNTALNVAVSRYTAGTDSAVKFYETLLAITNETKKPFKSAILDEIDKLGLKGPERVKAVEDAIVNLQTNVLPKAVTWAQKEQIAKDILALSQNLAVLEAMSPIEITVDLQVRNMSAVTNALSSMTQEAEKFKNDVAGINADYNKTIADSNAESLAATLDFGTQRQAALRQFNAQQAAENDAFRTGQSQQVASFAVETLTIEKQYQQERVRAAAEAGAELTRMESDYGRERVRAARDFGQQLARMERDFGRQRDRAVRDFGQQMARSERDFGQQMARSARDYQQQMERSERDFNQGIAKGARDFQRQKDRSQRDFNRGEARTLEDFQRQQNEARRQNQIQEQRDLQEHLRDLQRMQRDYDRDRLRDSEDFELERAVLLAEGRIAEAQVLASRFQVDQRRKAEDFATGRSDKGDDFARGNKERTDQLETTLREQQEEFDRARAQRLADFELQNADAKEAYDQQLADAIAAHAQQVADAQAAYAQQVADAKEAHQQQVDDANAAWKQQKDDADQAYAWQVEDAKTAFAQQEADAAEAHARQVLEFAKNFAKQAALASAAHATQMSERSKNFRRQQADDRAAFVEEQKAAKANFDAQAEIARLAYWAEEQKRAFRRVEALRQRQADYALREKELRDHNATQKKELENALADAQKVEELIKASNGQMDRQLAEAIVSMGRATAEYEKMLDAQAAAAAKGGKATASAYIQALAKTLYDEAIKQLPAGMTPAQEFMIPKSPIKRGPLANHEQGARKAGEMYVRALAQGVADNEKVLADALAPYRELMMASDTSSPNLRALANQTSAEQRTKQPIYLRLEMGSVQMDGRSVGRLIAPHVAEVFSEQLDVSAQVVDAVYTPGVRQQAFRSPK